MEKNHNNPLIEDNTDNSPPLFGLLSIVIIITIIFSVFSAWMLYEADGLKHPLMKTDRSTERDSNINP